MSYPTCSKYFRVKLLYILAVIQSFAFLSGAYFASQANAAEIAIPSAKGSASDDQAETLIVCPKNKQSIPQLSLLLKHPLIDAKSEETQDMFKSQAGEITWLKGLKTQTQISVCVECLAACSRIAVKKHSTESVLIAWTKQNTPGLSVQANTFLVRTEEQPFSKYQWGLKNLGSSQTTELDPYTTLRIPGTQGEDVGLSRAKSATSNGTPVENMASTRKIRVAVLDTGVDVDIFSSYNDPLRIHPNLNGQIVGSNLGNRKTELRALYDAAPAASKIEVLKAAKDKKAAECIALDEWARCKAQPKVGEKCDPYVMDLDGNGYPLDCYGWSLVSQASPVRARNTLTTKDLTGNPDVFDGTAGHGTHVAGVIGASANNFGIEGVIQNVEILPVKVLEKSPNDPIRPQSIDNPSNKNSSPVPVNPDETNLQGNLHWKMGFVDVVARGVLYAIRNHAEVINLSLSWPELADSQPMRDMIKLAQQMGIVVVAAAGNDSTEAPAYPCSYEGVICVAAHGPDGAISHFSNFGPNVDTAAPGLHILSTFPVGMSDMTSFNELPGFEIKNGTSMASPFVVGVVARLLRDGCGPTGCTPREAYARIMSGFRPHRDPQAFMRNPLMPGKFTRSGNIDLELAANAPKQPLILAASSSSYKPLIHLIWDKKATELPFNFSLKNYWEPAGQVTVTARVYEHTAGESSAALGTSSWTFKDWPADATKTLQTSLRVLDSHMDGRLFIEVSVNALGTGTTISRSFRIPLDITVPISPSSADPEVQVLPMASGSKFMPDMSALRTVTSADGRIRQDYIAFSQDRNTVIRSMQLLLEEPSSVKGKFQYRIAAERQYTPQPPPVNPPTASPADTNKPEAKPAPDPDQMRGTVAFIQRLNAFNDGQEYYVIMLRRGEDKENNEPKGAVEFHYFDRNFKRKLKLIYTNRETTFQDTMQWVSIPIKDGSHVLVPAWVAPGKLPAEDAPKQTLKDKLDKHPKNDNPIVFQYYELSPDGIHVADSVIPDPTKPAANSTSAADDFTVVAMLIPSEQERAKGETPVLLRFADKDNGLETYQRATYRGKQALDPAKPKDLLELSKEAPVNGPLELKSYRTLIGLLPQPVLSLDPFQAFAGTAMVEATEQGTKRTTILPLEGTKVSVDAYQVPLAPQADSVVRVSGIFQGGTQNNPKTMLFSETHYDIQFQDLTTGEQASTSMRRYSFFPRIAGPLASQALKSYFPIVLGDLKNPRGERIPGMLVPTGLGDAHSTEVIVPSYNAKGALIGLARPARLRLEANPDECMPLQQGIDGDSASAFRAVFFCHTQAGDSFVRVPMSF